MQQERFWSTITAIKFKQLYYDKYRDLSRRADFILSGICLIVSSGAIAAWGIWQKYPALWSVLIAIAQVIQVLRPLFPYGKQISALDWLIPDLAKLASDAEHEWLTIHETPSDRIVELIKQYDSRVVALESRFTSGIYFPERKEARVYAESENNAFFAYRYGYTEGGETIGRKEATSAEA